MVDAITSSFLSPTLPKHPGKSSYVSIQDTHRLLIANAKSIKVICGRGQNSHLGLVLTATKYAFVCQFLFVCPTDPGYTPNIPTWTTPLMRRLSSASTLNSVNNTKIFVMLMLHSAIKY